MKKDLPIACSLPAADLARRRESVAEVFAQARRVEELADGYELVFPGGAEWATRLAGLVAAERACCPFLTFEMLFGPGNGPIRLRMTGPEGTKDFMRDQLPRSGTGR